MIMDDKVIIFGFIIFDRWWKNHKLINSFRTNRVSMNRRTRTHFTESLFLFLITTIQRIKRVHVVKHLCRKGWVEWKWKRKKGEEWAKGFVRRRWCFWRYYKVVAKEMRLLESKVKLNPPMGVERIEKLKRRLDFKGKPNGYIPN